MKNDFCDLPQADIQKLKIPDDMKGLLLSAFQFNDDGTWVRVPRGTFKEMIDIITEAAVRLDNFNSANP